MTFANSKLRWLTVLVATGLIPALILPGCGARSEAEGLCGDVTAVASDAQKMKYVKEWIASHLSDQKFLESIRRNPTLRHKDERLPESGGLDWKYLGVAAELTRVEFNRHYYQSGGADADRYGSVSLQLGRSFIVIRLGSTNDLGLDWSPEYLSKLKAFGDDVFVFCDGSADSHTPG